MANSGGICSCLSAAVLFGLSALLIALSIICHVIALATDYWLTSDNEVKNNFLNLGLFRACFDNYYHKYDVPYKLYNGCHNYESQYYYTMREWLLPGIIKDFYQIILI